MEEELSPEHQVLYDRMTNAVEDITKDLDPASFLLKFTANEYYLFRFLELIDGKEITVRAITERLNLSHATVHKCIKSLLEKQLIERGYTKYNKSKYIITKDKIIS